MTQESSNFSLEDRIELGRADIFIALDTLLQLIDDFKRSFYADIGSDERFLEIVKYRIVDRRAADDSLRDAGEKTLFSLIETLVESLHILRFILIRREPTHRDKLFDA